MRRVVLAASVLVLAALLVLVPRLEVERGDDPFPTRIGLDERAQVSGGSVRVDRLVAAPRWTRGSEELSLKGEDGVFLQVHVTGQPAQHEEDVIGTIEQGGRTWTISGRAGSPPEMSPPGFDDAVVLTFEVPAEVLDGGELRVGFVERREAVLVLDPDDVERVDELEPSA